MSAKTPAKRAKDSAPIAPLYVNTQTAEQLVGVDGDTLIAAVKAGKLRAKRTGANGGGRYLFKLAWLEEWADGLVDA